MRQVGIQGALEHLGRQSALGAEADHLSSGVDAGIGPPAGGHADQLSGDRRQGRLQNFLDRRLARLDLPASVRCAVVGYGQFDRAHARTSDQPQQQQHLPFCPCCLMSNSAICTALVAAPLRRLSLTHHRFKPLGLDRSSRMRPITFVCCQLLGMG